MTAEIVAVFTNGFDAAPIKYQPHILEADNVAAFERHVGLAALKRYRLTGGRGDADDVLVNGKVRVDVADRKDGSVRISVVAEIEIAAERQFFDQHRGLRMRFLPSTPFGRHYARLFQLYTFLRERHSDRLAEKCIKGRVRCDVLHHFIEVDEQARCP